MATSNNGQDGSSFLTQADALLRKNLVFQRRNVKQNIALILFPAFLCVVIVSIQSVINSELDKPSYKCGCRCVETNTDGTCSRKVCGVEQSSTLKQASACPIPKPREWPAFMQLPAFPYRAVRTKNSNSSGLPDASCRKSKSCAVTSLFTGQSRAIAEGLVRKTYENVIPQNAKEVEDFIPLTYLGTRSIPGFQYYIENALISSAPIELVLPKCPINFKITVQGALNKTKDIFCVRSNHAWRNNSTNINRELFQGYWKGNPAHEINEIVGAYDFSNTGRKNFNVTVWYNSTYRGLGPNSRLLRIPKPVNMLSNAFLRQFGGREMRLFLDFVKEMPKSGGTLSLDLSTVIGPLLYSWVIQLMLPVFLEYLVYEKEHKLRTMMKLHGLRDGPYWVITYSYFLLISCLYMLWFATFGYIIGLNIFRLNSYTIQILFYFLYLNLQIALALIAEVGFSSVKTARVVAYMYVFGSGLLGDFLFRYYIEDTSFSRWQVVIMEMIPGFLLYRGVYELQQYSISGNYRGTKGMSWDSLDDKENGMKEVLIILVLEWSILLGLTYLVKKVLSYGNIVKVIKKTRALSRRVSQGLPSSSLHVEHESSDLLEERYKVEQLLMEPNGPHPVVCHNLKKVYGGKNGAPNKRAVRDFSLCIPRDQCFGLLGPSGSGKTTFINMMTGFLLPTSGTALINNLDVKSAMDQIQTKIGVCPQHDVIWETLTGREHLRFYGRLRNLKGAALNEAVEESLRSFNLDHSNAGDKLTGCYSGGMKRRLSVGISIIGGTKVVFLDEPSTGLDIESRNYLWHVIKQAKRDRAIVLTTHSMEEADFLCDRLGIIVNGKLQCLGNSKELKTRYGRSHLLTISVNPQHKENVDLMVANLSPNAAKVYDVGGTQKFQLPRQDVRICDVFEAVDKFRREIPVFAFGLNGSSLEDVFNNVVSEAS